MKQAFTNSLIERAKRPGGKIVTLTDARTHGLQCIVSLGAKTFYYVFYRNGKGHRVKIGRWPETSVEFARAEAHRMALIVRQGKDPRKKTDMNLLEAFNYTVERKLLDEKISEATEKSYRGTLMLHCKGWLKRDILSITEDEIAELKYKLTKSNANAVLAVLSVIWRARKLPKFDISKYALPPRKNLSDDWAAWHKAVTGLKNQTHRNILLFMALTATRKVNTTKIKWDHVDFDKKTFFLPKTKTTDNITQPLSQDALAILRDQQGLDTVWVFPSNKGKGHIVELRDDRVHARPHDLRRLHRECCELGLLPEYAIGKLRGDKPASVAAAYNQTMAPHEWAELAAKHFRVKVGLSKTA